VVKTQEQDSSVFHTSYKLHCVHTKYLTVTLQTRVVFLVSLNLYFTHELYNTVSSMHEKVDLRVSC